MNKYITQNQQRATKTLSHAKSIVSISIKSLPQFMKRIVLQLSFAFIYNLTLAQVNFAKTDTTKSIYGALETRKFYVVSFYSSSDGIDSAYRLNDMEVDKSTYDRYYDTRTSMETCKPCILMTYDINDRLLYKAIQYSDCAVGYSIEYHPNGKVKLIGHYKENPTGNWFNAWADGYCSSADGVFTYFNENGEELYSEVWKDGEFINQIPVQTRTELWNVELTIDSVKVSNQVFTPKQVNRIKITPRFKNSLTEGTNISIKFIISTVDYKKYIEETISIDNFHKLDVQKMLDEAGIKPSESASCNLMIYNNAINVFNYWITLKQ